MQEGATHVGVASDHVIESFRNDLWPGYKTSEGMPPELLAPDAGAGGRAGGHGGHDVGDGRVRGRRRARLGRARSPAADDRVEQVVICTPDKDLGQCVTRQPGRAARPAQGRDLRRGRRRRQVRRAARRRSPTTWPWSATRPTASPASPGWGAKSAAAVLAVYGHLEDIPPAAGQWEVPGLRGAAKLLATSCSRSWRWPCCSGASPPWSATCPSGTVDDWQWRGPDGPLRGGGRARSRRPASTCSSRARRLAGRARHTRRLRRRPGDLRHTGGTAEGCCLPALT